MDVPRYKPLQRRRPAPPQASWYTLPAELLWLIGQWVPRLRCVDRRCRDVLRRWSPDDAEVYLCARELMRCGHVELRGKTLDAPISLLDLAAEKEHPWEARHVLDVARASLGCSERGRAAVVRETGGGWVSIEYSLPHKKYFRNQALALVFPSGAVSAKAAAVLRRVLRATNNDVALAQFVSLIKV